MWFFVCCFLQSMWCSTDSRTANVSRKKGWGCITGLETSMGSLNVVFDRQKHSRMPDSNWGLLMQLGVGRRWDLKNYSWAEYMNLHWILQYYDSSTVQHLSQKTTHCATTASASGWTSQAAYQISPMASGRHNGRPPTFAHFHMRRALRKPCKIFATCRTT